MQLTADQELRRELLLVSLSKQPDLEGAINLAAQMEQFVLKGSRIGDAAAGRSAALAGNGTEHALYRTESESPSSQTNVPCRETGSDVASLARPNGAASGPQRAPDISGADGGSKKRRWSTGDDERLRRLWQSDHSLEEIAEAMGRTTPSLYSRARALGMAKRSPVVDKRDLARSTRAGRESASTGAAPALAGEDDIPGEAGQQCLAPASGPRRAEIEIRRYGAPSAAGREGVKLANGFAHTRQSKRSSSPAGHSFERVPAGAGVESGVEPIIHFLRSRDYSVVRVEDGRFRVDGRLVLNADELREKANKVRQSLGKPPFAPQSFGSIG